MSLNQFRWMALLAIPLLVGPAQGPSPDYTSTKEKAERFYAEKSYARAHALYAESQPQTIPEERWVAFRLADTRWRMDPEGGSEDAQRELSDLLESKDISVKFAIHPVAGRMPGHMNVLLAEADVPYENLIEMDKINSEFPETDVALVIGANDVVNPDARTDKGSPIYGMPILDVDRATHVFVIKRSMNPGFAGIQNPLFFHDNTMMIFGDAKKTVMQIIEAVRDFAD